MVYAQTKADGSIVYYVSLRRPENWLEERGITQNDTAAIRELLTRELATWDRSYLQPISAAERFTFLPMRRLHVPWERRAATAMTLIGDAAHLMPPFAGIGVNIALVDALELAAMLIDDVREITDTLTSFERAMFSRAAEAQEETARNELAILSDKTFAEVFG
jgi:2-polyprenyl-6-methoxyphenol hydroxylase-like FAD-dependent oxidoreductase